jgi:hypothetical protein
MLAGIGYNQKDDSALAGRLAAENSQESLQLRFFLLRRIMLRRRCCRL